MPLKSGIFFLCVRICPHITETFIPISTILPKTLERKKFVKVRSLFRNIYSCIQMWKLCRCLGALRPVGFWLGNRISVRFHVLVTNYIVIADKPTDEYIKRLYAICVGTDFQSQHLRNKRRLG